MLTQNATHFTLTFSKQSTDRTVLQSTMILPANLAITQHMAAFEEHVFSAMSVLRPFVQLSISK